MNRRISKKPFVFNDLGLFCCLLRSGPTAQNQRLSVPRRLRGEGIADKELSALLARDLLVPIVHDTTYEALRDVSPLLGSRSGLSTAEAPMADVAAKLAELVAL